SATLEAQERSLTEREAKLSSLNGQADSRDAELNERETELNKRDAELSSRRADLDDREASLQEQENVQKASRSEFDQRANRLQDLDEVLGRKQSDLETLQSTLDERNRSLSEREATLEKRVSEIAEDRASLESLRRQYESDQSILANRETEVEARETALQNAAAETPQAANSQSANSQSVNSQDLDTSSASVAPPNDGPYPDDGNDLPAEDKQHLLQEFASRQESLARREAELIRREAELTERELHIASAPESLPSNGLAVSDEPGTSDDASQDSNTHPEGDASVEVSPDNPPLPSTWEEVLGTDEADELFVREVQRTSDRIHHPADEKADSRWGDEKTTPPRPNQKNSPTKTEPAEPGLSVEALREFRRSKFEERFGLAGETRIDPDESMRIDVTDFPPDGEREMHTLVTNGMSDFPIPMPNGQRSVRAELLLHNAGRRPCRRDSSGGRQNSFSQEARSIDRHDGHEPGPAILAQRQQPGRLRLHVTGDRVRLEADFRKGRDRQFDPALLDGDHFRCRAETDRKQRHPQVSPAPRAVQPFDLLRSDAGLLRQTQELVSSLGPWN
ncbi:MAG: hypothetical protein AAGJ83_09660, partial [Planctomycetota bacterium]